MNDQKNVGLRMNDENLLLVKAGIDLVTIWFAILPENLLCISFTCAYAEFVIQHGSYNSVIMYTGALFKCVSL